MRDYQGELTFDPRLPKDWEQVSWCMQWHGARLSVTVRQDELALQVRQGPDVSVTVRGEIVEVGTGEVRVSLDGQGPHREGLLEVPLHLGERRHDGSRITATVPHSWSDHENHPELEDHG